MGVVPQYMLLRFLYLSVGPTGRPLVGTPPSAASLMGYRPVPPHRNLFPVLGRVFEKRPKLVLIDTAGVGVFRADHFFVDQIHNGIIERLHSMLLTDL